LEASFSKSFRGYDVSQVDAYVQSVENFETETQNTLAKSNQKTADLEAEVSRLREIESSLFRALKLAEESQQNFVAKMEKESKSILDKANKEAEAIKKKAETDALKQALLTENERKQSLAQANQDLKEQERQLRNLQEAQNEIAAQLKAISEQIVGSVALWDTTVLVTPLASIESSSAPVGKRGRKPGVKNKPKAKVALKVRKLKPKLAIKAKPVVNKAKPVVKSVVKPKPALKSKPSNEATQKAAPAKRGPKPKAKPLAAKSKNPAAKRGPKPKIRLESVSDDGLPTLNKVLEAYAKSSGPRGKVGDIN
jgi:cell division initiation protein